jgi:hypothetical protein
MLNTSRHDITSQKTWAFNLGDLDVKMRVALRNISHRRKRNVQVSSGSRYGPVSGLAYELTS